MLRIGLTGGIGSGKSTVAKVFESVGIPVYYADAEAKRIMNEDPDLRDKIVMMFGEEAYSGGQLNRAFIASIVFNDQEKLALLNSFVHPVTIRDSEEWMALQTSHYAIREAALTFESGINRQLDYVIGVVAPEELRIERVIKRDGIPRDEVLRRIKNQMEENEKIKLCDFRIINDEKQLVVPQVLELHQSLLQLEGLNS